ncbi:hypothetical protein PMZ80_006655 [Knufia obscura]|uniref:Zn(2)-C6 fungal-type domain-containing protein n=1 Tax=Knufia obscura TaxID=1635080 RepID=A0ABR0RLY1_9EURO|nr:hypothetical protein PMZ80_006655 [Knufia obscura]
MSTSVPPDAMRHGSLADAQHRDIAADLLEAAAQASAAQESAGESGDEVLEESPNGAQKPEKRKKRSLACQACRNMKIRCNPVEGQDACLACSKVNRQCIMPGPARKRQKTVHKVAELEKKINLLTQSLLAKSQVDPTPQPSPNITEGSSSAREPTKDAPEERSSFPLFPKNETPMGISIAQTKTIDSSYEDVIDQGIISFAIADRVFDQFIMEMNPLCPLISFPPGTTFESIRRTRPMLSLAIMAAGCVALVPEVHETLTDELAKQLANRIFFLFERSLDLMQASLIHVTWVGKHKAAKEVGFNMYIHSAIVMGHDLGLSKRLKTPLTKDPVEEAEMRRTWLACYWSGASVSTTLRHPPMIRTSPYIDDCLAFFARSPAALATDHTLCAMVKLVTIMEDVAACFHMDDPASVVRLEDASTQYSLKLFETRLENWRRDVKDHLRPDFLELLYSTGSLYCHEIAMHSDHNVDDFRPPAGRPGSDDDVQSIKDFITPSHLNALTKCVVSMKTALEAFINIFPSPTIRHLPCLYIVWTAYSAVAMIRLDGALRASKSKYAEIFLPEFKIEYYLDAIVERLSGKVGPGLTCGPVPMFVQAFQKLKVWHSVRLAGTLPAEFADIGDPQGGMNHMCSRIYKLVDPKEKQVDGSPTSNTTSGVENGMIGPSRILQERMTRLGYPQQQQQGKNAGVTGGTPTGQAFDTQGGSWLTNANMPIDASMFENQDWNFSLEEWNNFEASMVQPAGGTWLGYLL